jgi:UDP-glucose 4-epimerase
VGVDRVRVVDDLSLGDVDNLAQALDHPQVQLTSGDASDIDLLQRICSAEGQFDRCYNLAVMPLPHSLQLPRENVERNIAITTAACELGRRGGFRRLIHCSSSEVYGSACTVPMHEDHPLQPHTPYAAAKAATDLTALSYARTFGLDVVVVRPFNTYGERQNAGSYAGVIPAVIRAALTGSPVTIHGDGEQTRDMTYVGDTVRGIILAGAAQDARGETFNLGTGREASVNELVRLLLDELGRPDHPVVHSSPRPGDVRRLVAGTARVHERLSFAPAVTLREGLRRTAVWYRARSVALGIDSRA